MLTRKRNAQCLHGWPRDASDSTRQCVWAKERPTPAPERSATTESRAQLLLCPIESPAPLWREVLARPIDVEAQHRHGRAERLGLAPPAGLGGPLERQGDRPRTLPGENAGLQIERVTFLHDTLGPSGPTTGGLALGFDGLSSDRSRSPPGGRDRHSEEIPSTAAGSVTMTRARTDCRPDPWRNRPCRPRCGICGAAGSSTLT